MRAGLGLPSRAVGTFLVTAVVAGLLLADRPAAAPAPVERDIAVRFDPDSGEIEVADRFTPDGKDIALDLAPWMELVEARRGDARLDVHSKGGRISIPDAAGQPVALTLRGVVPGATDPGGGLPPAIASPEGSYLSGYAGWMADVGNAGLGYRLTIEVPAAYRAVATGRLESEELGSATNRATFVSEGFGEAPSIFVGPYVVEERIDAGLRLRTYFHPEQASLAADYLDTSKAYIDRYAELIGPYPYAGFSIVSAPAPVGLGFSSLTYVSRRILPLPFMRGRSLAHEILHNWWGNGVAVDYARGNWAEGLTTYMADYALAEHEGEQPAREMRLEWLRNLTALPDDQDMAVARFVSKTHDTTQVVGYDKTALIFHMLRREIGDEAFRAALQSFWNTQRFQVAAWSDLQHAFEQAAGRELGWFFDQWLTRPGLPQIALDGATLQESDAGYDLAVTLRQEPPAYRLRLPVVVETSGESERLDLIMDSPQETLRIALEQRPSAVHIDPDFHVARRLAPGESPPILRDVTLSDKTVLVVPSRESGVERAADRLAGRLLQRRVSVVPADAAAPADRPLLVIGLSPDVARYRAEVLSAQPDGLASEGTARSWTEAGPGGLPWLFVSADDLESLEGISRPLPHYRRRSFVVFDDGKVVRKGLWPTGDGLLSHRFD